MPFDVAPALRAFAKHVSLSLRPPAPALLAAALLVAVVLAGCSKPAGPPCFPVRGTVTQDGKPLVDVMVVFHPLSPPAEPFPLPLGHTDVQGKFELQTLRAADGAPAGEYAVTLELRELRRSGEELTRDGKNLLPPRYATPRSTPLRYTVVEGENEVPPIAISAR